MRRTCMYCNTPREEDDQLHCYNPACPGNKRKEAKSESLSYLKSDVLMDALSFHPKEFDGCNVRIDWRCNVCGDHHVNVHVPSELTIVEDIFEYALGVVNDRGECDKVGTLQYENCEITDLYTI